MAIVLTSNRRAIMKGKNKFTTAEIDEIKRLINKKIVATKDEQKRIRDRIRDIGFYFSDYSSKKGYTVADLEELIRAGVIKVVDDSYNSASPTVVKKNIQRLTTASSVRTTSTSHSKKSLAPLVWDNTEILILGTMPGDRSLELGEYYAHPQNRFWKIISTITNNTLPLTYLGKKELLIKTKIGVWDVAHKANRKGSLDSAIEDEEPNDLVGFIECHKNLKIIGFNGTKSEALFDKYFDRKNDLKYISLPSTSPANTGIDFDNIYKLWRQILAK